MGLVCFYTETAEIALNRQIRALFAVLTERLECGRLMALAGGQGVGMSPLGGWGSIERKVCTKRE